MVSLIGVFLRDVDVVVVTISVLGRGHRMVRGSRVCVFGFGWFSPGGGRSCAAT